MFTFTVCPHDVSIKKNYWIDITNQISKAINKKIDFKIFDNFSDYKEYLLTNKPDIVYANFDDTYSLIKQNYIPFARFKKQKDTFYLVTKEKKEINSIAIVPIITNYITLIDLKLDDKKIYHCKSYEEIIEKIEKNEVDAGIVYKDSFKSKNLKILGKNSRMFNHYFCAKKEIDNEILEKIIKTLNLKEINKKEITNFKILANLAFSLENKYFFSQLQKAIKNIYKDIIFSKTEEKFCEIIGKNLINVAGFSFVYISKEINNEIIPLFENGKSIEKELILPIISASKEKEILYKRLSNKTNWENKLLKKDISSVIAFSIEKNNEKFLIVSMYSPFTFILNESARNLYFELKENLELLLKNLEDVNNLRLIFHAAKHINKWFLITDENGKILFVNNYVLTKTGSSLEELLGKPVSIFKSNKHPKRFYKILWETIKEKEKSFATIIVNRNKKGELFTVDQTITPFRKENKLYFISFGEVLDKDNNIFSKREKYRFYDQLTNLLNMYSFNYEVSKILEKDNSLYALMLIDIRKMAYINAQYGMNFGNEIIQLVAKMLKNNFKKDLIGRIGGDEFGVFVKLKNIDELPKKIQHIVEGFKEIKKVSISYNIGISLAPNDGIKFEEIYQKATLALNLAKNEGENIIKTFEEQFTKKVYNVFIAERLIQKALKEKLFTFYFQPYYDNQEKLCGFESLIRIKEKDNIHYPNEFIDYLENSKYLEEFEKWALDDIAKRIEIIKKPISINISAKALYGKYLFEKLENMPKFILDKLTIEITERNILQNVNKANEIIKQIKTINSNIKISIDDFGTGYSSLAYLKDLEVDILKIDMSFIRNILNSQKDLSLVEIIAELAQKFNLQSVAEGVEEKEHFEILKKLNIDYFQGYYLAKPMSWENVLEITKNIQVKNL